MIFLVLAESGQCVINARCEQLQLPPYQGSATEKNVCYIHKLSVSQPAKQNFFFHVDYATPNEIDEVHFAPSTGAYKTPTASDIAYIPREIFIAFPNLAIFDISTNISELTPGDFNHAFNLTMLNLQDNNLKIIKAGIFTSHPSEISKNADGLFPLHKLIELGFSFSNISEIEANSFNGLTNLEQLHLQYNKLRVIRRESFAGLPSLNFIDLRDNGIETIEDGALDLPKVADIHLAYNKLTQLSDTMFNKLPSLTHIALDGNGLNHIGRSLYRLPKVEKISLDWNQIEDIDLAAFAQLPSLRELRLDSAGAIFATTNLDDAQHWNSSLKRLHINNNKLPDATELSKLRIFPNLDYLGLMNNAFINLDVGNDRTLKDILPSLHTLYICENPFDFENGLQEPGVAILNGFFRHNDTRSLRNAVNECVSE